MGHSFASLVAETVGFLSLVHAPPKYVAATDGTLWRSAGAAFYHDLVQRKYNDLLASLQDPRALAMYRRGFRLSQSELARLSGISKSLLCRVEAGQRKMTEEVTLKLWQALWRVDQEWKTWSGSEIWVRLDQETAIITQIECLRERG
jgi:predicted transcriptional regulator